MSALSSVSDCWKAFLEQGVERRPDASSKRRHRATNLHASMSFQIFRAHANAYCASASDGAGDKPPLPATASIVFFSALYRCTDETCTTVLSSMKL